MQKNIKHAVSGPECQWEPELEATDQEDSPLLFRIIPMGLLGA
jgi:hypothetical protein